MRRVRSASFRLAVLKYRPTYADPREFITSSLVEPKSRLEKEGREVKSNWLFQSGRPVRIGGK